MLTVGALCAGTGGIELGLTEAGIQANVKWYAENDNKAAKVMAHHHPNIPNLGDIRNITAADSVDIITAGFPCQPVSQAGKRKGTKDARWIIDEICRVARTANADYIILENVYGILTASKGLALGQTCRALATQGYSRWQWGTLRASEIGAPHQRNRWFCLAITDTSDQTPPPNPSQMGRSKRTGPSKSEPPELRRDGPRDNSRTATPDTDQIEPERWGIFGIVGSPTPTKPRQKGQRERPRPTPRRSSQTNANPTDTDTGRTIEELRHQYGTFAEAIHRWEQITRPAPEPTTDGRLSAYFVEWMMGLPKGWVTTLIGNGELSRAQALGILGNGVVPQQVGTAIRRLAQ